MERRPTMMRAPSENFPSVQAYDDNGGTGATDPRLSSHGDEAQYATADRRVETGVLSVPWPVRSSMTGLTRRRRSRSSRGAL